MNKSKLAVVISTLGTLLMLSGCASTSGVEKDSTSEKPAKKSNYSKEVLTTYMDRDMPPWVEKMATERCYTDGDWFYCIEQENIPHGADPGAGVNGAVVAAKARISEFLNSSVNSMEQRLTDGYNFSSKQLQTAQNSASQVINQKGIVPRGSWWRLTEERIGNDVNRNYECYALVGMNAAKAADALNRTLEAAKRTDEPEFSVSEEVKIKGDDLQQSLLDAAAAAY